MVKVDCDANHPNNFCRATDNRLRKAYKASAIVARLACSKSLLLVHLEDLLQDLSSTAPSEGKALLVEMRRLINIQIYMGLVHIPRLSVSLYPPWSRHGVRFGVNLI